MNPQTSLPPTFWGKVEYAGDHWLWVGAIQSRGYGSFAIGGRTYLAHRLSWQDANGEIPQGLVSDHLCRIRACVNPAHMELVTTKVNNQRGKDIITHCPQGHEYTPENTRPRRNGNRECMTCFREAKREWNQRNRDKVAEHSRRYRAKRAQRKASA